MRSALSWQLILFASVIFSAQATIFQVSVGANLSAGLCIGHLFFEPRSIVALPRDEVHFILHRNIPLTESEFGPYCKQKTRNESSTAQGISFPAAGSTDSILRLVLLEDYDGAPLQFFVGNGEPCLDEAIFFVNPPSELPVLSYDPAWQSSLLVPCSPASHLPGFDDQLTRAIASAATAPASEPSVTSVLVEAGQGVAESIEPQSTSERSAFPQSTIVSTVAVLQHTTLVKEYAIPQPSSKPISNGIIASSNDTTVSHAWHLSSISYLLALTLLLLYTL